MSFPARRGLPNLRPHLPIPSSSSSSCLHPPIVPSPSAAPFSTSAALSESKTKRKARLVRKSHLEKKAALARTHALEQPDPVLGYARDKGGIWETSLLKSVLLDRKDVWGETVKVLPDEMAAGGSNGNSSQDAQLAESSNKDYVPKNFNFGLDSAAVTYLAHDLPLVSAQAIFANQPSTKFAQLAQDKFKQAIEEEQDKKEKMMRIVDLRNAGSKGIEVENTRRIVAAFGRHPGDTGLPEVQAAILTARIHSLASHLASQPRDVHNRRPLRSMIQQRTKMLKYLRSLDVKRYEVCLEKIGVEARAVEGEVIVTKPGLRALIRSA